MCPEVGLLHKHPATVLVGTAELPGALAAADARGVRLQVEAQLLFTGEHFRAALRTRAQDVTVTSH